MQSSVTKSKTFATKSLPASFKYCNYLLIYSKLQQNIEFQTGKQKVSLHETSNHMPCDYRSPYLLLLIIPFWKTGMK